MGVDRVCQYSLNKLFVVSNTVVQLYQALFVRT